MNLIQQKVYVPLTYGQKMLGIQKNWLQPRHIILKVINCGLNREDSQLE